ncbi:MAG: single-stranded DNA-binding protein [Clostridia bacterium]|nr:single-stranded DNA-binding protein [Clostridia bacterium]
MNKVILLGRMAREPEVRFTQGNEPTAVCRFSVAVERPYSSKRKEGDATADFINCVCFGKRGENIGQYFHKGNRIAITGRLQVSNWQDNNGQKRYSTDVIVEDFEFCENKGTNNGSSAPAPTPSPAQPNNNGNDFFPIDDDEELPF